jgi:uncharacterized protein YqjF (DUF2071 family)
VTSLATSLQELLETPSRQAAVESETAHRPWPVPDEPWVVAQTWDDLLFAHYRVDSETLRSLVPQQLAPEEHDGSAWLSVTPFVLTGFRLRGTLALPAVSTFPELNVRTYVTVEDKPGIWFFSLDTSSRIAVEAARAAYKLPYHHARISVERRGGHAVYACERISDRERRFEGRYGAAGEVFNAEPESLEWFLTERYCLYAADRGRLHRAEIQHPPWPLQSAEAEIAKNTIPPPGLDLEVQPVCHYSHRQDVLIWPLRPL